MLTLVSLFAAISAPGNLYETDAGSVWNPADVVQQLQRFVPHVVEAVVSFQKVVDLVNDGMVCLAVLRVPQAESIVQEAVGSST